MIKSSCWFKVLRSHPSKATVTLVDRSKIKLWQGAVWKFYLHAVAKLSPLQ